MKRMLFKKLVENENKRYKCERHKHRYNKNIRYFNKKIFLSFSLFLTLFSGCGNKFFDPAQIGRFRPVPAVNVILDSLGVAEEAPMAWEEAEEPHPIDTVVTESDYALMPGDVIRVAIFELLQEGIQFIGDYVVTETGRISIPDVGVIKAAGLTETQLEEEIKRILSPTILKEPSVSVILTGSQQRSFSILGNGVPAPSRYTIPRYNFRLTDALAMAGGPQQFNVSYIYVSRYIDGNGKNVGTENPGYGELNLGVNRNEPAKSIKQLQSRMLTNRSQAKWPKSNVVVSSSEMITERESALLARNYGMQESSSRLMGNTSNQQGLTYRYNDAVSLNETASVEEVMGTFDGQYRANNKIEKQDDDRDRYRSIQKPVENRKKTRLEEALKSYVNTTTVPNTIKNESNRENDERIEWIFQNGKWVPFQVGSSKKVEAEEKGSIEWIFQDGKWVPVQVGTAKVTKPKIEMEPEQRYITTRKETAEITVPGSDNQGAKTRLIKIPVDKLLAGDPRYNIVIKPGDSIFVPVDLVGEFYIGGNVNRTGTITITGRPLTLKQAIVAAGGLGPLAWPKRCEVVRRIGRKKEEIVMVDLDKIANGEQPDFFIKPNDLINVGTHATSRWRAILRNAFRATYGFGFVYDRNFADRDYGTHRPAPDWF